MPSDDDRQTLPDGDFVCAGDLVSSFGRPAFGLVDAYRGLMQFGRSIQRVRNSRNTAGNPPNAMGFDFSSGPVENPVLGVRVETKILTTEVKNLTSDVVEVIRDLELKGAAKWAWWNLLGTRGRKTEMRKIRTSKRPGIALTLGLSSMEGTPMDDFPREVVTDQVLRVEALGTAIAAYRWYTPGVVHAICVEDESTRLLVGTFGFETEELPELFQHIGRIDDRPDVLLRYDSETKDRLAQLRRSS